MSAIPVEAPVKSTVVSMLEANHRTNPPEIPISRNPVAVSHVARSPHISGARARWNVSDRSAHMKSEFGRLRRRRTHARRASHHRCSQHPIPNATHNPFIPPAHSSNPARLLVRWEACLVPPLRPAGYVLIQQDLQQNVAA